MNRAINRSCQLSLAALAVTALLQACTVPGYSIDVTLHGRILDASGAPVASQSIELYALAEKVYGCGSPPEFEKIPVTVTTDADGAYSQLFNIEGAEGGDCSAKVEVRSLYFITRDDSGWHLDQSAANRTHICPAEGWSDRNMCAVDVKADFAYGTPAPFDWKCFAAQDMNYTYGGPYNGQTGVFNIENQTRTLLPLTQPTHDFFYSQFPYNGGRGFGTRFCIKGFEGLGADGAKAYFATDAKLDQ